jgi:hypothetical protein
MRQWIALIESADWRGDLRQIVSDAAAMHVELEVETGVDSILLIHIERLGSKGGEKGAGAKVLWKLCELADQNDLMIFLHVAGGMRALVDYYGRFGFEMDEDQQTREAPDDPSEEHPDADEDSYGYEVHMYRAPRLG